MSDYVRRVKRSECPHDDILPIDDDWGMCGQCGDRTFPMSASAAGICDHGNYGANCDDCELATLLAELEQARAALQEMAEARQRDGVALAEARAKAERYRRALEQIAADKCTCKYLRAGDNIDCVSCWTDRFARTALSKEKP